MRAYILLNKIRNKLEVAEVLLSQLQAQGVTDPELVFEIFILEMDLFMRRGSFTQALAKLEAMAVKFEEDEADILHRVRLLTLKTKLLLRCKVPLKGFSGALRAASLAWRARLLPAMWEALAVVAKVLVYLREFRAAVQITNAITPQVSIPIFTSISPPSLSDLL